MDGDAYWALAPAADALAHKDPLAATLLYRAMIGFALDHARSARYRHAARHLRDCASLAASIADWRDHPDHEAYVAVLRGHHRSKAAFWARAGL